MAPVSPDEKSYLEALAKVYNNAIIYLFVFILYLFNFYLIFIYYYFIFNLLLMQSAFNWEIWTDTIISKKHEYSRLIATPSQTLEGLAVTIVMCWS